MVIGSHAGLVGEEHRSSGACSLITGRRVFLFHPPPYALGILLVGAYEWPLRRKPEAGKQLAEPLERVGQGDPQSGLRWSGGVPPVPASGGLMMPGSAV